MAEIRVTELSHLSHLVDGFVAMREAGELFDYVIRGSDESFPIHSLVLASMSPVFKTMLQSKLDDAAKKEVEYPSIQDCIIRKIVDFAYTGTCAFNRDELMPLIETAHYLQMTKLLSICEEEISAVLEPCNCFSWLLIAKRFNIGVITSHINRMMFTSHKEVIQSLDYREAEASEIVEYLSSLNKKGVHNNTLVHAVLIWTKHDPANRAVFLSELFKCISIGRCTKPFLSNMVKENDELLETQPQLYKFMLLKILDGDIAQHCENLLVLGGQSRLCVPNNCCWILEEHDLVDFAEGPGHHTQPVHSICKLPQGVMMTGGKDSNICKLFDVANRTWVIKAALLCNRWCHGSGYIRGKLFVIGGILAGQETDSVDFMDLDTNIWQHGPAIPGREYYPKSTQCNSSLFVLLAEEGALYCLWTDGTEMAWAKKTALPQSSRGCSIAAADNKLYAAGGDNNINFVYTPDTDTWCSLTGPSLSDRHGSLVYYRQRLLLIGGCRRDQRLRDVEEYDVSSDTWSLAEWKLPTPLWLIGAFVFQFAT